MLALAAGMWNGACMGSVMPKSLVGMLVLAAGMWPGACMGIVMPKSLGGMLMLAVGMRHGACMGIAMPKSLVGMLVLASGMWHGACMGIVMPKSLAGMLMVAAGMLVLAAGFGDGPGVAILGLCPGGGVSGGLGLPMELLATYVLPLTAARRPQDKMRDLPSITLFSRRDLKETLRKEC